MHHSYTIARQFLAFLLQVGDFIALPLPVLDCWVIAEPEGIVSFEADREGLFLYIRPIQFALVWPWVPA